MSPVILQIVLQAVSSFAIAGGLIYTAFQFRAGRKAEYVGNFTRLVELQFQLRKMRVDDPALAGMHRADRDAAGGSEEALRAYYFELMQLSLFEIAWFSHANGQLPEDYFKSWVSQMKAIAAEPTFQRMWAAEAPKILHDDFRSYVDELLPPGTT